jgi:hypothetical protein
VQPLGGRLGAHHRNILSQASQRLFFSIRLLYNTITVLDDTFSQHDARHWAKVFEHDG